MKYIDKDALVAKIDEIIADETESIKCFERSRNVCEVTRSNARISVLTHLRSLFDTLEVKKEVECKRPEYSYFKTKYQRGKRHYWDIGDILAYYHYSSNCEGEHIIGQIVDIKIDEEQDDWVYTFENGRTYYEEELLDKGIYVKVKKK